MPTENWWAICPACDGFEPSRPALRAARRARQLLGKPGGGAVLHARRQARQVGSRPRSQGASVATGGRLHRVRRGAHGTQGQ